MRKIMAWHDPQSISDFAKSLSPNGSGKVKRRKKTGAIDRQAWYDQSRHWNGQWLQSRSARMEKVRIKLQLCVMYDVAVEKHVYASMGCSMARNLSFLPKERYAMGMDDPGLWIGHQLKWFRNYSVHLYLVGPIMCASSPSFYLPSLSSIPKTILSDRRYQLQLMGRGGILVWLWYRLRFLAIHPYSLQPKIPVDYVVALEDESQVEHTQTVRTHILEPCDISLMFSH